MKMRIALAVVAAAMMPFSAFASPNPQQLVDGLTTDLRYDQHNVDDTRHSLSHPLLRDGDLGTRYFLIHPLLRHGIRPDRMPWLGSEDPRRLLEDSTTDLLLGPRTQTDGNDLETVPCGSAQAPTWKDFFDLLELCERFFEPGFAAVSGYSEDDVFSFTVNADAAVVLNIDQLADIAHHWAHGLRQTLGLDAFRITITSSHESLIGTIEYSGDRWSLSFVHGSAGRQDG
ncbi:MAG: hypothetical protein OXQ31_06680 [Spirochaetaceae bacterium]|nr:hypothetical protein [Spirochaetaceae bacterium]